MSYDTMATTQRTNQPTKSGYTPSTGHVIETGTPMRTVIPSEEKVNGGSKGPTEIETLGKRLIRIFLSSPTSPVTTRPITCSKNERNVLIYTSVQSGNIVCRSCLRCSDKLSRVYLLLYCLWLALCDLSGELKGTATDTLRLSHS